MSFFSFEYGNYKLIFLISNIEGYIIKFFISQLETVIQRRQAETKDLIANG